MSQSNDRAPWTLPAIKRTMPTPRDCDLGYEASDLRVQRHYDGGELDKIVLTGGTKDAWITATPSSATEAVDGAIDMEWFASFEDTRTKREYE